MATRISYIADSVEPVSPAEAKLAARVDTDALDDAIASLITAAREQAELITGKCYRPQVRRQELSSWPAACDAIDVHAATACEVRYWTSAGWSAPLSSAAYVFAPGGIGGDGTVLAPITGTSWPALADRPVGPHVRIDLTTGPDSAADVPECVKLYIKASVAAWLKNPEALALATLVHNPLHARLLDGETLHGF